MGRYMVRRLLQFVPVFVLATFLIFALVFIVPGDPIRALSGSRPMPATTLETLRAQYNLDDPLLVQYGKYLGGLLQGDLGTDFRGREVSDILLQRLPVTVKLTVGAFVFEAVLGLAAGVLAGLRRSSFLDNLVLLSTVVVVSIPVFVLAFVVQLYVAVPIDFLPVAGARAGWESYILPSIVLGAVSLAYIARLTRTSLVENLRADYVRTANAKGLTRGRVVGVHALRNSLIPVVTFLGVDVGNLMGGAIVTETVFNLPGIGSAVFEAVQRQEGTVVVGIVTFLVVVYMVSNLLVDVLYAGLDPRIRYE